MTKHIDDLITTMEQQRGAWHDAHDHAGIPMDALVSPEKMAQAPYDEAMDMARMGISREDIPYKPQPWADLRPLNDGKPSIPPTVEGTFWIGVINALGFEVVAGFAIYLLAHWHMWSRMVALLSAWRLF